MKEQIAPSSHNYQRSLRILCFMIFLNYMDRGVVPGAPDEFMAFIERQPQLGSGSVNLYFGLLTSTYVLGYIFGSLIFGHASHFYNKFFLIALGCAIWVIAVLFCGFAGFLSSYELLLVARVVSGIGEASLHCTVPPWIQDVVTQEHRGRWLAFFMMTQPVGVGLGYAYGAGIASTIGWEWAFILLALLMIPGVLYTVWLYYLDTAHEENPSLVDDGLSGSTTAVESNSRPYLQVQNSTHSWKNSKSNHGHKSLHQKQSNNFDAVVRSFNSLWGELRRLFSNRSFVFYTLGTSAIMFSLKGIGTFGATFFMGLGYFDSEALASASLGIILCLTGIIATPLGGFTFDVINKRSMAQTKNNAPDEVEMQPLGSFVLHNQFDAYGREDRSASMATDGTIQSDIEEEGTSDGLQELNGAKVLFTSVIIGTVILCSSVVVRSRGAFLFMAALGLSAIFFTSAPFGMLLMMIVPKQNRAFAFALNTVMNHLLGDVPSPLIVGAILDRLVGTEDDDSSSATVAHVEQANFVSANLLDSHFSQQNLKNSTVSGLGSESDGISSKEKGMRICIFLTFGWLLWSVLFYGLGWRSLHRRFKPQSLASLDTAVNQDSEVRNPMTLQ